MQNKKEQKPLKPLAKKANAKAVEPDKTKTYGALFIILLVSYFVYQPALSGAFVWDDSEYVLNNPWIRSINLKEIFSHYVVGNYHPLTILTLAIEHGFFAF